jgi:hypothetical protein
MNPDTGGGYSVSCKTPPPVSSKSLVGEREKKKVGLLFIYLNCVLGDG